MAYSQEERETIITTDDTMDCWDIYTRQIKIINKMDKLNIRPYKVEMEDGRIIEASYKVNYKQLSFRKLRELTEEQKQEIAQRLHRNKNK